MFCYFTQYCTVSTMQILLNRCHYDKKWGRWEFSACKMIFILIIPQFIAPDCCLTDSFCCYSFLCYCGCADHQAVDGYFLHAEFGITKIKGNCSSSFSSSICFTYFLISSLSYHEILILTLITCPSSSVDAYQVLYQLE